LNLKKKTMKKTHYRKAFKSDHLASHDIEALVQEFGRAVLHVKEVKYFENRKVAGRTVDRCLVAFFHEPVKPMVVNSGNSDILAGFIGSQFVDDWVNLKLPVEFYVKDDVKLSGSITKGIRLKRRQPKMEPPKKPQLPSDRFEKAVEALTAGTITKESIINRFELTKEQKDTIDGL